MVSNGKSAISCPVYMSSFCKYAKPRTLFKNFPLCYPSISFYTSFLQSLSVLSSALLTASLFSSWYPRTVFTNQGSLTNDHESTVQCIQYSIYFLHVQYSCIYSTDIACLPGCILYMFCYIT